MAGYDIKYSFYGDNKRAIECQAPEVLLIGPAETGKTIALLWKIHRLAFKYKDASLVILRKTLTSAYSTVLQTWQEKIVKAAPGVRAYGGEKPEWFDYPTGSRVWIAGLDKSSRVLSAEHDCVYCNQTEELSLDDWETLTTRTTGRAGHVPYPQTMGDANPSWPRHWMYQREGIKRFFSWHKDNPNLFDPVTGEITEQGEQTMARLSSLTGMRRVRLFEGKAVMAEGAVYPEFGPENIVDDEPDPDLPIELAYDDGYAVDPRAILFVQRRPDRVLVFDEIYDLQKLEEESISTVLERCAALGGKERPGDWRALSLTEKARGCKENGVRLPEIAVGSTEAGQLMRRFRMADIVARGGTHTPRTEGVKLIRGLICDGHQRRILQIHRRCVQLIDEMQSYRMNEKKDEPMDGNDHGLDAIRYWAWVRVRR